MRQDNRLRLGVRQPEASAQSVTKRMMQPPINIAKYDSGTLTAGAEYERARRQSDRVYCNLPEEISQAARADNHAVSVQRK